MSCDHSVMVYCHQILKEHVFGLQEVHALFLVCVYYSGVCFCCLGLYSLILLQVLGVDPNERKKFTIQNKLGQRGGVSRLANGTNASFISHLPLICSSLVECALTACHVMPHHRNDPVSLTQHFINEKTNFNIRPTFVCIG